MGVLGDLIRRSSSSKVRKEERSRIYHPKHDPEVIDSGEYLSYKYNIITDGETPSVEITRTRSSFSTGFFAGCDIAILKVGGKYLRCSRERLPKAERYTHVFDDAEYTVDELHTLAKSIIDSLDEAENKFLNN